jgi:8-hydroxy-5-deazaflavin:NADPH oxidoreductase
MKTAVIGLGNIGARIAKNLVIGGQSIIVAARDLKKAKAFANTLGGEAEALPIADALKTADVIILGLWFDTIKEFVVVHRASLAGKIIVDPSNPIAPDGKGGFAKTIPADQSSGEIIAKLLPEGAELVKAFGTVGAASLEKAAHRKPEPAVLFYATDYPEAGRAAAKLITASGFAPVGVGGLDQSLHIEAFGELSEYGKLGKLVTKREAEAIVKAPGLQLKSA